MSAQRDISILRELASRHAEIAALDIQDERRDLWRRHNSLIKTRPLIYVRWFAAWAEVPQSRLQCEDPFFRAHENSLRQSIFQYGIGDDTVTEPWITQRASIITPPRGMWGVEIKRIPSTEPGGAWKYDPPLKEPEDLAKLISPHHIIDEEATERSASRLHDAVGDILHVHVDRSPAYQIWHADISTDLAYLRGLDPLMWDMMDNAEWLHELLSFMSEGIIRTHDEAEGAGQWTLANHQNQAVPYAGELPDPCADGKPVNRDQLWIFVAAQEFALISPAMHEEFLFRYQLPIMEKFGLLAYGCCEDLTHKIDMLRQARNLRRIAVTPWADVGRCAEQIGEDYVLSWRPNPAEHMCRGFDPGRIRKSVSEALEAARGCHIDITIKDVQTIEHDAGRPAEWARIVREIAEDH